MVEDLPIIHMDHDLICHTTEISVQILKCIFAIAIGKLEELNHFLWGGGLNVDIETQ